MDVSGSWAPDGHVLRGPRIWPEIRAGIAELKGSDLGIKAATRAREEIGSALERAMERGQWSDTEVHVTLTRTGKLLFSEPLELIAGISNRVIAQINEAIAAAGDGGLEHARGRSRTNSRARARRSIRRQALQ